VDDDRLELVSEAGLGLEDGSEIDLDIEPQLEEGLLAGELVPLDVKQQVPGQPRDAEGQGGASVLPAQVAVQGPLHLFGHQQRLQPVREGRVAHQRQGQVQVSLVLASGLGAGVAGDRVLGEDCEQPVYHAAVAARVLLEGLALVVCGQVLVAGLVEFPLELAEIEEYEFLAVVLLAVLEAVHEHAGQELGVLGVLAGHGQLAHEAGAGLAEGHLLEHGLGVCVPLVVEVVNELGHGHEQLQPRVDVAQVPIVHQPHRPQRRAQAHLL
jgi:hypothetical protein